MHVDSSKYGMRVLKDGIRIVLLFEMATETKKTLLGCECGLVMNTYREAQRMLLPNPGLV